MDKKQKLKNSKVQHKSINSTQQPPNKKQQNKSQVAYLTVSLVSLLLFISLRIINNPNKYEWCNQNGWSEGIGDCFNLGIEHFMIDASSLILLSASIAFAIIAVIFHCKHTD